MANTGVCTMRHHVLALLLTYSAAFLGGANTAWAQTQNTVIAPQERVVSRDEFYYYDENKLRRPLNLSRSVAVRFPTWKPLGEREQYLKQFGPLEVRQIAQLYSRVEFALDYMPTLSQDARAATIKRLAAEQDIEVAPIFTVDGMDAVVDGIYLQTVTPMSRETIVRALGKYFGSGIGIHEVTPEGDVWHVSFTRLFFLDSEKLPLTVLSVANLMQASDALPWVKRAYPKFAFLNTPVIPSISVFPMSGTVGEERTVVLGFRIFGKTSADVMIEDSDIPELMQGSFEPKANGSPPQSSFWEVIGTPVKEKLMQVGPNEWYFEHRYTLGLYAPEPEWVFSSLTIPYMYRGVRKQMTLPATTFFVRPHLDAKFALQDIPRAFSLPVAKFPGFTQMEPTRIRSWFDPAADMIGRENVATAAKIAFGLSAAIALACFGTFAARIVARRRLAHKRRGIDRMRLAALLKQAEGATDHHAAIQAYHGTLSEVLHAWDSKFPRRNVTYQDVKDCLGASLEHLERALDLEDLFGDIESRNEASFSARDENEVRILRTNMRLKIEKLAAELEALKKGAENELLGHALRD